MNPKRGRAHKVVRPKRPTMAGLADTADPGGVTVVDKSPVRRRSECLGTSDVLEYQAGGSGPIPSDLFAFPPPVPQMESEKPCGIGIFKVTCQHKKGGKNREPNECGVLQVVPECQSNISLDVTFCEKFHFAGSKAWGGNEEIYMEVKSKDGQPVNRKQTCLTNGVPPSESMWKNGAKRTEVVPAPINNDLWLIDADPDIYMAYGRGCDDVYHAVRIEVFPSQQYQLDFDLDSIDDLADDINKDLKKLCTYTFGIIEIFPQIAPAAGSCDVKWGWAENDDWRVFHLVEVNAALRPMCGVSLEILLSLVTLVAAKVGIPPVFTKNVIRKYLADIYLQVGIGVSTFLEGSITGKFFRHGKDELSGSVRIGAEGNVTVTLCARIGHESVVSVQVEGGGETGLSGQNELELNKDGLFLSPKIEIGGLEVFVGVELKAFKFEILSGELRWQIFEPFQVFPNPNRPFEPYRLCGKDR
ncbi:MAG: hypothetical protein N3J91_04210 [Verrucomicrobiae bacterium]|nr:hypothetical protein [Verrucomicrobiae bacterium]